MSEKKPIRRSAVSTLMKRRNLVKKNSADENQKIDASEESKDEIKSKAKSAQLDGALIDELNQNKAGETLTEAEINPALNSESLISEEKTDSDKMQETNAEADLDNTSKSMQEADAVSITQSEVENSNITNTSKNIEQSALTQSDGTEMVRNALEISIDNQAFSMPINNVSDYDKENIKKTVTKAEKSEKADKPKKSREPVVFESEKWVERNIEDGIDEQIPFAWKIDLTMPDKKAPINKLLLKIKQDFTDKK